MTSRNSSPSRPPVSRTTGTGTPGRPATKLFTIEEVAETFNVSSRTVRRLIDSGALPVHRLGRIVRISAADLAAFLAATRSL